MSREATHQIFRLPADEKRKYLKEFSPSKTCGLAQGGRLGTGAGYGCTFVPKSKEHRVMLLVGEHGATVAALLFPNKPLLLKLRRL
ncbi:hypothetical protein D5086_000072 [Populus alba]|uniref:Uncharacterized protein n=1 Tax=Populus alba TaxID=43335 RepID=A0ACC4CUY4_POPAL